MPRPTDPRPLYTEAHRWCLDLVRSLRTDEMGAATPCAEWDVRTVVAHLVGAVDRARVVAEGGAPFDVPVVPTGIPDEALADRYAAALAGWERVWADDDVLACEMTAPWGVAPGRDLLLTWVKEPLVHGWDLAVATGRPAEGPEHLAAAALADAERTFPADRRGGPLPFGAPVEPGSDAGPTERLAAWLGHRR